VLSESLARRYSAALFALAQEANATERTAAELDAFVDVLQRDKDLVHFFESPVVGRDEKNVIVSRALAGRFSELVVNFIMLLVRKRREKIVGIVARQLHEMLDEAAGRAVVSIEAPQQMPAAKLAALARRLSGLYRRQLVPRQKVAPELLGGVVVHVGDRYVDASVAGRLEELRRQLLAAGDRFGASGISTNGKPI
jgi:F-type H+-transporting ATPase subunit delta